MRIEKRKGKQALFVLGEGAVRKQRQYRFLVHIYQPWDITALDSSSPPEPLLAYRGFRTPAYECTNFY